MKFILKTEKIVGEINDDRWGQIYQEDGIFVLLETGKADSPAVEVGKEILTRIIEKLNHLPERNLANLKVVIEEVRSLPEVICLTIGLLVEKILYVANLNGGQVILKRGGKTAVVVGLNESASGLIADGDVVFFTSAKFNEVIPRDLQEKALNNENIREVAEGLAPLLLEKEGSDGSAGLLVVFSREAEIEEIQEKVEEKEVAIPEEKAELQRKPAWSGATFISREKVRRKLKSLFNNEEENLDPEEAKSKKTLTSIALILLLVLTVSVFFGLKRNQGGKTSGELKEKLDLVEHQYNEASSLIDLNPVRARSLLDDAKITLMTLRQKYNHGDEEKRIDEWLSKISSQTGAAAKAYKLTDVPVFFDLTLLKSGGQGERMALYDKTAVILDSKNKVLYTLGLDDKKAGILAGADLVKNGKLVAIHGGQAYTLTSDGIIEIDLGSKAGKTAVKKDEAWGTIQALVSFGGNLYLVDRDKNQIWKYVATEAGFSERRNYLNSDVHPDFTNVSDVVIDGSVWALSGNDILKFTSGRPDQFNYHGLVETIGRATALYTSDEAKSIYLLDQGNGRIFVFDKDGTYQSQYEWAGLKTASDFVVAEDLKKIIVLSGSKIYAIDIK